MIHAQVGLITALGDAPVLNQGFHGAIRLSVMTAVRKAALSRREFRKMQRQFFFREPGKSADLQRCKAGRIRNPSSAREGKQLGMSGRMLSPAVLFAELSGFPLQFRQKRI